MKRGRKPLPRVPTDEAVAVSALLACSFIMLPHGKFALVDKEIAEREGCHNWHEGKYGYVVRNLSDGRSLFLHKLVLNCESRVDHRNRTKLDCRRENLRECTNAQNAANSGKQQRQTSSRFKGVSWDKQMRKFRAGIVVNARRKFLGLFNDERAAALAYNAAAMSSFGEFACLNSA